MPRSKRIIPECAALHVISRGNNRNTVFRHDNDKLRYYALLQKLKGENKIDIFHYCLMNNHVHIILNLNPDSTLSKFMKQLNLTYFHYYRKKYGYVGHFWQDRFKSNIIDQDSYLLQCGKYIELNPVRARLVKHPQEYLFSSYNYYANGKQDELIVPNPAYLGLSDSTPTRQKQYINFIIDDKAINSIVLRKKLYIGSQLFITKSQEYYNAKNKREHRGRPFKTNK